MITKIVDVASSNDNLMAIDCFTKNKDISLLIEWRVLNNDKQYDT